MIIITRKDLKKKLNKAQETIKMLNQELLEANQGMIALTLELKQAQEEYKNIFENSIVGIYRATVDHQFKMVNPALADLLEYESPENLINNTSNINEEIYIDTVKRRKFIHHLFKKGSVVDHESQVRSKKGKKLWILENASLLKDEHSNITGYEAIVQDITKRKQIEKELAEYRNHLEKLVKERTEQIKNKNQKLQEAYKREEFYKDLFTHDINNILQSLLSGIQVCKYNYRDPESLKTILNIFKSEVLRGARLVSNIRKLSQLETDEVSLQTCNISAILRSTSKYIRNKYIDKKINLKLHPYKKDLFGRANQLLEDVFENLIINAIRHNDSQVPEIDIRESKIRKESVSYIKVEFIDNGVGVKDGMKKKIFRRGLGRNKSVKGLGLGLSLVKTVIDSYNGDIWVEDRVKGDHTQGSNFIVIIPEAIPE